MECDSCSNEVSEPGMCDDCKSRAEGAAISSTIGTSIPYAMNVLENGVPQMNAVERDYHAIQDIKSNGDIFNNETHSFIDLKIEIDKDDSITDKDGAFFLALSRRHEHLRAIVFEAENTTIPNAKLQDAAVLNLLRDFGNQRREEFRAKIKEIDDKYMPILPKPVKAVVKKEAKTATADRILEKIAIKHNCTLAKARELFISGKF